MNMPKIPGLDTTKDERGNHRWDKLISFWTCISLTIVFIKHASVATVDWTYFIAYPVGMAISCSPYLAIKLITAWRGEKHEDNHNSKSS